jgi:Cu-Zn family superoxide dismutase
LKVQNLPPGQHAAHLHEKGDCSAADGSSAGGHWNPMTHEHGKWDNGAHHLGDIGNIEVQPDGSGTVTLTTDKWTIGTGQPNDIVGKAIIVHEKQDDFQTQPTGNAGGRVGCGVVTAK